MGASSLACAHVDSGSGPVAQFAIANRITALREMSDWLATELRRLRAPAPLPFAFDLCASEAAANIIGHAWPQGGTHEIELRLFADEASLTLEIEDDGVAFDPLAHVQAERPGSLEAAPIGGLGIDLIRHYMHECHYARRDGRNVLRLTARIS
jgi:anti-sigma regulatory factor (Ser/Thr protein kinase)